MKPARKRMRLWYWHEEGEIEDDDSPAGWDLCVSPVTHARRIPELSHVHMFAATKPRGRPK